MTQNQENAASEPQFWTAIKDRLRKLGVDVEALGVTDASGERKYKVVVVAPDLRASVEEMGQAQRDQVVMVRVDEEAMKNLDAWVATGAVKSRSEAAALFIGEGLKIHASELAKFQEALREVDEAKAKLRDKVREVFGRESGDEERHG